MNHKSKVWRVISMLLIATFVLFPAGAIPRRVAAQAPVAPAGPTASGDHLVIGLNMTPTSPNILKVTQNVNISFQYTTTEANGVRIFIRPFSNGALSPGYTAHPSPIYPAGSGQGSGYFTITSGEVVVDQIRIQMWNSNQTTLLFEAFLPVYYLFTNASNVVTNFSLTPDTPNVLHFGDHATATFDYTTNNKSGVYIWIRPFTNGNLTPNYAAHGSPLYPSGSGRGNGYVTISSGQVVVDQLRVQMWDAGQTTLLFEAFLPVYYRFMSTTNSVSNFSISPPNPNIFKYGDKVYVYFDYQVNSRSGARIWVRPFSGTHLSPDYVAHGSGIYTGSGSSSGYFTLSSGPTVVDRIRVQMWDANQTTLLYEAFLSVHLLWAGPGPAPGPDMHLDAIEVTQGIQDLNNSVVLVAGKRTYVRVHVSSPTSQSNVYATLRGRRGIIPLMPVLSPGNPGGDITVLTSPDRGALNDSFWFALPTSWTSAGSLTLTAYLDPNNATFDPNTSNNTKSVTVNFLPTPPLRLKLVDVQYTSGGHTYRAANNHLAALESWLRRAYPISSLEVTRQDYVYPNAGLPNVDTLHGYLAIMKLMNILFSGEDSRIVYYGVVDDGGGFMRGKTAGIPSTISAGPSGSGNWGWDYDGSYNDWYGGHEIGHSRGRYHAEFCGAGGGVPYPYTNGRISPALNGNSAIYGFDITTFAIYPPTWKDVMTYCDYEWISDFTYEGIRDYLVGVGLNTPEPQQVTASQFLVVSGMANLADNTVTLNDVYKITQKASVPLPEPGDWSIDLLDASGATLKSYAFAPRELTDSESNSNRPAVIAEIVPWASGTIGVAIRYQGQTLASRTASANAPSVSLPVRNQVTHPNATIDLSWNGSDLDGDTLTYSVLYSLDGGASWTPLINGVTDTSLSIDTDKLPGGTLIFKIIATDGFLTGETVTGSYTIPLHAPEVQVDKPTDNAVFFPAQTVNLQASAFDMEDGTLGDSAFQWTSSINGDLGTGANLSTAELSAGQHTITVTVTDSDNMSTQAARTITIGDENTVETVNLDAAPLGIGILLNFGESGTTYTLTLRASTGGAISWTASESLPWLSMSATSGTTPDEITLTIDPTGLPVGTHNGIITLTSTDATNSPIEIPISVQINGYSMYLPFLQR